MKGLKSAVHSHLYRIELDICFNFDLTNQKSPFTFHFRVSFAGYLDYVCTGIQRGLLFHGVHAVIANTAAVVVGVGWAVR